MQDSEQLSLERIQALLDAREEVKFQGSEFINDTVSGMLKKLWVGQTKSRPRKSNDNGLVESKNGAVIRSIRGTAILPRVRGPAQ